MGEDGGEMGGRGGIKAESAIGNDTRCRIIRITVHNVYQYSLVSRDSQVYPPGEIGYLASVVSGSGSQVYGRR
jgi:hypothetical protein